MPKRNPWTDDLAGPRLASRRRKLYRDIKKRPHGPSSYLRWIKVDDGPEVRRRAVLELASQTISELRRPTR